MAVNRPELITAKNLDLGSVSFQGQNFGNSVRGKAQERRIRVSFPTADAPVVVRHGLGKKPSGYTPVTSGKGSGTTYIAPGIVYSDVPLVADTRSLVLKCSVGGSVVDLIIR